jgi:hypothetical protein
MPFKVNRRWLTDRQQSRSGKWARISLLARRPLNCAHVVVHDYLRTAVVPLDGDTGPILLEYCAAVVIVLFPPNAIA